jgi:hypothetical protein
MEYVDLTSEFQLSKLDSPDLQYVSTYYASKYAAKIFAVLDIIPVSFWIKVLPSVYF